MRKVHNRRIPTAGGRAQPPNQQLASAGFFIPICAMNLTQETVASVAAKATTKAAPPAVVAGLNWYGITLPELVQLVTLIWLLILIVDKVWSLYRNGRK
jgi:hypothetical protein